MAKDPSAVPLPAGEAKPRRSWFALLFKSALGCSAFALGGLIVLVLLLPSLLSSKVRELASESFGSQFHGTLEIESLELAWFGPQEIHGAALYDPEHRQVTRFSAVLPSLWALMRSGGTRLGRIALDIDAELEADDRGVTNLQRALEPRRVADPREEHGDPGEEFDALVFLADLQLELEVASRRLSWSDADTRRVGVPFVLEDLRATVQASPGQPLVASAHGKIAADQPGTLDLDARIHGPIQPLKAWPFGKLDADVRIERFSSAMVDGLANLDGALRQALGPRFDLVLQVRGATSESGDIELVLNSERSSLRATGRFTDGVFHSNGEPALVASLALPQSLIERELAKHLPAGARLELAAATEPCKLELRNLRLPLPDGAPGVAGNVWQRLEPTLAGLRGELELELPAAAQLEVPALSDANVHPSLASVRASVRVEPDKPLDARFALRGELAGPLVVEVDVLADDPWKALAAGALPRTDLEARIEGVSTAVLDALAGMPGRFSGALGPAIAVNLRAEDASLEGGTLVLALDAQRLELDCAAHFEAGMLRIAGEERLTIRADLPEGWLERELGASLPAGTTLAVAPGALRVELADVAVPVAELMRGGDVTTALRGRLGFDLRCAWPAVGVSNERTRAAKLSIRLSDGDLHARLTPTGELAFTTGAHLDTGTPGMLSVDVKVPDAWQLASADSAGDLPPIDATVRIDGLSSAGIDALANQAGRFDELLGERVALALDARAINTRSGSISFKLQASALDVAFAGRFDQGVLRAEGEDAFVASANLSRAWILRELGTYLPDDVALEPAAERNRVQLEVRELMLVLPDFGLVGGSAPPASALALLEQLSCDVRARIPSFRYADTRTREARLPLLVDAAEVSAKVRPGKPLEASLDAALDAGARGTLAARIAFDDPWFALRPGPPPLPAFDAELECKDLPSALLDALAGKPGIASELCGPSVSVHARADRASLERAQVGLALEAPTTRLTADVLYEQGKLSSAPGKGIELSSELPSQWVDAQLAAHLPDGTRIAIPEGAGPLTLTLHDIRLELPAADPATESGAQTGAEDAPASPAESLADALEMLSRTSLRARLAVPRLAYSDARTKAAGKDLIIDALEGSIDLVPRELPALVLAARIEDEQPGELDVKLRALDALESLAAEGGAQRFRVAIDARARRVPTGLVDALARQEGMLLDMLGPRLDLTVASDSLSLEQGAFSVDLVSEQAKLHASGRIDGGMLLIEKSDGTLVQAGLTPVFSERVVGKLVPVLFDLRKPEGAGPALVGVENLRFPLDGDLSKLDAQIHVELGQVSYRVLPGLETLLGSFSDMKVADLPPLDVPIKKGVASYDSLPVAIGGREYRFKGSFNLVDQTFKLNTEIPLAALGKKVDAKLENVRDVLDPKLAVPIEIRGTWKKPRVSIGDDFLKRVLEDAAKSQLEGLLEDTLSGKKKKKKD